MSEIDKVRIEDLPPIDVPTRNTLLAVAEAAKTGGLSIAQLLAHIEKGDIEGLLAASDLPFDPTASGREAEDVQGALDVICAEIDGIDGIPELIPVDLRSDAYLILPNDAGRLQVLTLNGGRTFTLPLLAEVPDGALFWVRMQGDATLTVERAGTDIFADGATSIALGQYETALLVKTDTYWSVMGRTPFVIPPFASDAEMKSATAFDRIVAPGRQHMHRGHPKAIVELTNLNGTPTINALYNALGTLSATRTGTGDHTLSWTTTLTESIPFIQVRDNTNFQRAPTIASSINGSTLVRIGTVNFSGSAVDPVALHILIFGDA